MKAFDLPFYYYSSSENPFTDTQRLGSHQVNINILYKMGITSGTSPTTFSPNAPISRAQAAVLITKTRKSKQRSLRSKRLTLDGIPSIPTLDIKDKTISFMQFQAIKPIGKKFGSFLCVKARQPSQWLGVQEIL